MNLERYFRSLGSEVEALKSRVRDLKDSTHWLTDGEWKESVLRSVLRRNLPESVGVGRGFVVAEFQSSHQLDVLVYERSAPVLFRDGDLVFVTPDAVLGIIEVKSKVTSRTFQMWLPNWRKISSWSDNTPILKFLLLSSLMKWEMM